MNNVFIDNGRDRLLWVSLLVLIGYGLVIFFSASIHVSTELGNPFALLLKQSIALVLGLVVMFCLQGISYRFLPTLS